MTAIHAWLADKDGYYSGSLDTETSPDDWDTFAANAAANGQTAIAKSASDLGVVSGLNTAVASTRPPDRPAIAVVDPAKAAYAAAATDSARLDAIAQKMGLK